MNSLSWLLGQCRQPRGWAGRLLARGMNRAHARLTRWALSRSEVRDIRSVLEIGCGGGATLLKLSHILPRAALHGIDYSTASLAVAARTNRHLIGQGRVVLVEADVSHLPYASERFDLAVSVESHYFWPDLDEDLGEIRRVLRSGGKLVLAGAVYFGGRHDSRDRRLAAVGRMKCQALPELRDALCEAGYETVVTHEEWTKGWFSVVGHKPRPGGMSSERAQP